MKIKLRISIFLIVLCFPFIAGAQSLFGDFVKPPTDIQRGLYMGTDSGLLFFLNSKGTVSNPGYNLSFFVGYDISRYLSFEGRFRAAINSGIGAAPINGGIYTFIANGLIRGFLPIKRIYPFVDIGGGFLFTNPDYNFGVSGKYDLEFGFGAEYFTFQRHFSLALRSSFVYVPGEIPEALIINFSLKYTF